MAYLVTGGSGLIGMRVARDLAHDGEQVVVYDQYPQEDFLDRLLSEEERTRVKIEQGDITDLPHLIHSVRENNVETIIHLAAMLRETSSQNPSLSIKVNCDGTANVFEVARILGLKRVVWASTIGVFGPPEKHPEEYIPNDAPHFPDMVYAACKSLNEVLATHYIKQYGMDISAIRCSFTFGIGSRLGLNAKVMHELVENPALGKPGRVPFGDDAIGWLYVNDVARALVHLSKVARPKTKVFTIRGEIRPVKEAVEFVKSLIPHADVTLLPGSIGVCFKFDESPIEYELGFRRQWSMEQGIKDSINVVRRQHGLPLVQ